MSMTNDEAIRILSVNGWGYTDGELKEATQMAIAALKEKSEAEEYRTPKKPAPKDYGFDDCPTCGRELILICPDKKFCPYCGQALDWSERENDERK